MGKQYKHRHQEIYKGVSIDVKAHTPLELADKLAARRKAIDRRTIDPKMRLRDFGVLFLETYKLSQVAPDWYDELLLLLNKIVSGIGNKPLERIKPIEIQAFLNSCSKHSRSYIKKIYDLTRQMWRRMYLNGATPYDYSLDLEAPSGRPSRKRRSITDYERKVLLDVLDGKITEDSYKKDFTSPKNPAPHRGEILCKLMLYCNLRPGEAKALLWTDIDFRAGAVDVNKATKKDGVVGSPKSDAGYRKTPIPEHFLKRLAEVKNQRNASPFDPVCIQTNGRPYTDSAIKSTWKNICRLMNIGMGCEVFRGELIPPFPLADDFVLYNLRHTCCTDYEKAGIPINVASRLMGHSSIVITSKIYTHAADETFEAAKARINGALENGQETIGQTLAK